MKIIYIATFVLLLSSCKKDTANDPVVEVADNTTNVSGKLKRVIQSISGTRKAFIDSFEYDATNRLTKLKEWTVDSSFNPIKISGEKYSSLIYNGASDFPVKSITTYATAAIDSSLYYYDTQNRVTKENWYRNNINSYRTLYTYGSNNLIIRAIYSGSLLPLISTDSLIRDNQGKIIETKSYNASNLYVGKSIPTYDTKINPLSYLNAFKYIYALNGDDSRGEFYRASNNITLFKSLDATSAISYTQTTNYLYSSNSFPISGLAAQTYTSSPTLNKNSTLKFEYY